MTWATLQKKMLICRNGIERNMRYLLPCLRGIACQFLGPIVGEKRSVGSFTHLSKWTSLLTHAQKARISGEKT